MQRLRGCQHQEMVKEGLDLKGKLPENVIIKIPCTPEGLSATRTLANQGIGVNVTLVFSVAQALLASKAGASYVSPSWEELDDNGEDGLALIRDISEAWRNQHITGCKITQLRYAPCIMWKCALGLVLMRRLSPMAYSPN